MKHPLTTAIHSAILSGLIVSPTALAGSYEDLEKRIIALEQELGKAKQEKAKRDS